MQFHATSIGGAWRAILAETSKSDRTVRDDGVELRELTNALVTIEEPLPSFEEDQFVRRHADTDMIRWMHDNFHSTDPIDEWGYSYGSRLTDFDGVDQIAYVKEKLSTTPESKSATISAMKPPEDSAHVPCICTLDFKRRNGLLLTAFFRSQDVGKKFPPDLLALNEIYEDIATTLGSGRNKLVVHIASAHVYETDYAMADEILRASDD